MSVVRIPRLVALFVTAIYSLSISAHAVTIDWVTVGDPGNAADTTGYGAVADSFRIMKFEFTNSQYVEFLNAIDPAGTSPNQVYLSFVASNARAGISIDFNAPAGSRYVVKTDMGDKPVNFVSWWDAARVCNWLHNGAQTYGSTDSSASAPQNTGAYTVGTATTGTAPPRNTNAKFYIPTEDQWYKAAYYKGGGTNSGYWDYATQSDTAPAVVTSGSTGIGSAGGSGNSANYKSAADWNGQDGNVTTVGTNGGPGAYGTFDMSGNIYEWNDLGGTAGSFRGLRGGRYADPSESVLSSSFRLEDSSGFDNITYGFRLASPAAVPEPSTYCMALAGLGCGGYVVRRRRKRA